MHVVEFGSDRSASRAHSEQAVVAHACHGHRYRPSSVPRSGTEKKERGDMEGVQAVRPRSVAGGG